MKMRLLSLAAAAALLVAVTPGPEARAVAAKLPMLKANTSDLVEVRERRYRGHRHFRRHHRVHRPRYRHRHYHHRHWRGPRIGLYIGPPRCSWLRRRALRTDSRYWWRRYNRCRRAW